MKHNPPLAERRNSGLQIFFYSISSPQNCGYHFAIKSCLAAGDGVFFVSSGNKDKKIQ
jgi:hypothetical protein